MSIDMLYGNLSFLCILFSTIFFYNECSSPKEALIAYLIPLSHHLSMTFYATLWSVCIVEHYKYRIALYY